MPFYKGYKQNRYLISDVQTLYICLDLILIKSSTSNSELQDFCLLCCTIMDRIVIIPTIFRTELNSWEQIKLFNHICCTTLTYSAVYGESLLQWMLPFFPLVSMRHLFKSTCDGCISRTEIGCLIFMSVRCSVLPTGCSAFLLYIPALFIPLLFLPQALFLPYLWTASTLNTQLFPYSTRPLRHSPVTHFYLPSSFSSASFIM